MGKKTKKQKAQPAKKQTSQERHARDCKVCNHKQCEAIEQEWTSWGDTTQIAKDYGLSRNSIYRHAEMMGLYEKRRRNIRAALERIIEKAGAVEVTAASVVSAIQAYAKINANGEWVERVEHVSMKAIFDRMSRQELETYAEKGTLPPWADEFVSATRAQALLEGHDG
jgi:ribosomal protein S14